MFNKMHVTFDNHKVHQNLKYTNKGKYPNPEWMIEINIPAN